VAVGRKGQASIAHVAKDFDPLGVVPAVREEQHAIGPSHMARLAACGGHGLLVAPGPKPRRKGNAKTQPTAGRALKELAAGHPLLTSAVPA
jgi:hypothetical protein